MYRVPYSPCLINPFKLKKNKPADHTKIRGHRPVFGNCKVPVEDITIFVVNHSFTQVEHHVLVIKHLKYFISK